jgi:hypothetical protein
MSLYNEVVTFVKTRATKITADSCSWFCILILHGSLIPSLLAIMAGVTDKMPPLDIALFIWAALTAFFVQAIITKNTLHIFTIGLGFIINSVLMAIIFFK